jgi:hypothetical protein
VHFVGSIQNGHCTTTFPSVKEGPIGLHRFRY